MTSPKPHPLMVSDLVTGQRYKVHYQLDGQRVPRVMLAKLVEVVVSKNDTTLYFDGRPEFGTVTLTKKVIRSMDLFVGTVRNFADRKVK